MIFMNVGHISECLAHNGDVRYSPTHLEQYLGTMAPTAEEV